MAGTQLTNDDGALVNADADFEAFIEAVSQIFIEGSQGCQHVFVDRLDAQDVLRPPNQKWP